MRSVELRGVVPHKFTETFVRFEKGKWGTTDLKPSVLAFVCWALTAPPRMYLDIRTGERQEI